MPLSPEQLAAMRGGFAGGQQPQQPQPMFTHPTEPEGSSDRWQITKGLIGGIDQTQGLLYGAAALAGDAMGSEGLRQWGMEGYERNMAEMGQNAPNVRFTEIDGIGDFGDWAAYTLGNLAPTMATMLATGGIGGAVAKKGIAEYGEKVLQAQIAKGVGQKVAEETAKKAVAKRIGFGLGAGSFAGSASMESGGIYGETEDVGVSLAHGLVAGSLDAWVGVGILNNVIGRAATDGIKKKIAASVPLEIASMVAKEGGTEALQGFIGQHASYWAANDGKSLLGDLDSVDWTAIIEEGAAGMLGGMAFGGGSVGYNKWRNPANKEAEADQSARKAAEEQGGDALEQAKAAANARMQSRIDEDMPEPGNPLAGVNETMPPVPGSSPVADPVAAMAALNQQGEQYRQQLQQITTQLSQTQDPVARRELGKQLAAVAQAMTGLQTQQGTLFNTQQSVTPQAQPGLNPSTQSAERRAFNYEDDLQQSLDAAKNRQPMEDRTGWNPQQDMEQRLQQAKDRYPVTPAPQPPAPEPTWRDKVKARREKLLAERENTDISKGLDGLNIQEGDNWFDYDSEPYQTGQNEGLPAEFYGDLKNEKEWKQQWDADFKARQAAAEQARQQQQLAAEQASQQQQAEAEQAPRDQAFGLLEQAEQARKAEETEQAWAQAQGLSGNPGAGQQAYQDLQSNNWNQERDQAFELLAEITALETHIGKEEAYRIQQAEEERRFNADYDAALEQGSINATLNAMAAGTPVNQEIALAYQKALLDSQQQSAPQAQPAQTSGSKSSNKHLEKRQAGFVDWFNTLPEDHRADIVSRFLDHPAFEQLSDLGQKIVVQQAERGEMGKRFQPHLEELLTRDELIDHARFVRGKARQDVSQGLDQQEQGLGKPVLVADGTTEEKVPESSDGRRVTSQQQYPNPALSGQQENTQSISDEYAEDIQSISSDQAQPQQSGKAEHKNSFDSSIGLIKFVKDNKLPVFNPQLPYGYDNSDTGFYVSYEGQRMSDQDFTALVEKARNGDFAAELQKHEEEKARQAEEAEQQRELRRGKQQQALMDKPEIYQERAVGEQPWRTRKGAQEFMDKWELNDSHYIDVHRWAFDGINDQAAYRLKKLPPKPTGISFHIHERESSDGFINYYLEPVGDQWSEHAIGAWTGSKMVMLPDTNNRAFKTQDAGEFLARIQGKVEGRTLHDHTPKPGSMKQAIEKIIAEDSDEFTVAVAKRILPLIPEDAAIGKGGPVAQLNEAIRLVVKDRLALAKSKQSGPLADAYMDLKRVYQYSKRTLEMRRANNELESGDSDMLDIVNKMGADEFVGAVLVNGSLRKLLRSIPYQQKTLWSQFVEGIRKLLRIGVKNENALMEVIRASDELMTDRPDPPTPSNTQEPTGNRTQAPDDVISKMDQQQVGRFTLQKISEKAFVVYGTDKAEKERFNSKGLGGKWHGRHSAWMFPETRRQEIIDALLEFDSGIEGSNQEFARRLTEFGTEWRKDGQHRIYFFNDDIREIAGIPVDGKEVWQQVPDNAKLWFDVKTDFWGSENLRNEIEDSAVLRLETLREATELKPLPKTGGQSAKAGPVDSSSSIPAERMNREQLIDALLPRIYAGLPQPTRDNNPQEQFRRTAVKLADAILGKDWQALFNIVNIGAESNKGSKQAFHWATGQEGTALTAIANRRAVMKWTGITQLDIDQNDRLYQQERDKQEEQLENERIRDSARNAPMGGEFRNVAEFIDKRIADGYNILERTNHVVPRYTLSNKEGYGFEFNNIFKGKGAKGYGRIAREYAQLRLAEIDRQQEDEAIANGEGATQEQLDHLFGNDRQGDNNQSPLKVGYYVKSPGGLGQIKSIIDGDTAVVKIAAGDTIHYPLGDLAPRAYYTNDAFKEGDRVSSPWGDATVLDPVDTKDDVINVNVRLDTGTLRVLESAYLDPIKEPKKKGAAPKAEKPTDNKQPEPASKGDKSLGKNEDGWALFEDHNGVRYYLEERSGVQFKIAEPVGIIPDGRIEIDIDRRRSQFKTEAELKPNPLEQAGFKKTGQDEDSTTFVFDPAEHRKPQETAAPERPADYGKNNKLVSEEQANKAREFLRKALKSGATVNSGLNPEIMYHGMMLATYHVEAGARKFADYARAMVSDIGDEVKPYLKSFYESARYAPGMDASDMDSTQYVAEVDIDTLLAPEEVISQAQIQKVTDQAFKLLLSTTGPRYKHADDLVKKFLLYGDEYNRKLAAKKLYDSLRSDLRAGNVESYKIFIQRVNEEQFIDRMMAYREQLLEAIKPDRIETEHRNFKDKNDIRQGWASTAFIANSLNGRSNVIYSTQADKTEEEARHSGLWESRRHQLNDYVANKSSFPSEAEIAAFLQDRGQGKQPATDKSISGEYAGDMQDISLEPDRIEVVPEKTTTIAGNTITRYRAIAHATNGRGEAFTVQSSQHDSKEAAIAEVKMRFGSEAAKQPQSAATDSEAFNPRTFDYNNADLNTLTLDNLKAIQAYSRTIMKELGARLGKGRMQWEPETIYEWIQEARYLTNVAESDIPRHKPELLDEWPTPSDGWRTNLAKTRSYARQFRDDWKSPSGDQQALLKEVARYRLDVLQARMVEMLDRDIGFTLGDFVEEYFGGYKSSLQPYHFNGSTNFDEVKADLELLGLDTNKKALLMPMWDDAAQVIVDRELKPNTDIQDAADIKGISNGYSEDMQGISNKADHWQQVQADIRAIRLDNSLVDWIFTKLDRGAQTRTGKAFESKDLFTMADSYFKGTQAEGKYNGKDAYDVMEFALNLYVLNQEAKQGGASSVDIEARLKQREATQLLLPTQTKRDDEQIKLQQFSTPHTHGSVSAWVANINPSDVMMEPTAGTANLVIEGAIYGPKEIYANELSERRTRLLEQVPGITEVFNENAEHLNAILPARVKPTVVLMNPPFSNSVNTSKVKQLDTGAKHVDQALSRMEDGGRLVAILGSGMEWDRARTSAWWRKTKQKYNVRAVIRIDGAEYSKFGTSFDNVIAVIDKTGPTEGSPVIGSVSKVEELIPLLKEIRNDRRTASTESEAGESVQPQGTGTTEGATQSGQSVLPPAGRPGTASGSGVAGGQQSGGSGGSGGDTHGTEGSTGGLSSDGAATAGGRGATGNPQSDGTQPQGAGISDAGAGGQSGGTSGQSAGSQSERVDESTKGNVTLKANQKQQSDDSDDSVFSGYQPQYSVKGARPHMNPLSESLAMASVPLPELKYSLSIPEDVIELGYLTDAQLEAVAYAGQAHTQKLPDGTRKGFFIGDGTGVGKTNEIMGTILDNWQKGRKRHVIVTENEKLLAGVKGWADKMGIGEDKVFTLKDGLKNPNREGILFVTYGTLQTSTRANASKGIEAEKRLDQITAFLGAGFDGVLAFDESHNMKSAVAQKGARGMKKPSARALAGVDLQRAVPDARVLYASATGATEVYNLGYADRLGLWGEGTPFNDKNDFIHRIDAAGLAAMEVVAKDLKAQGSYIARSLSFEGVTQSRLTHELTDNQKETYNQLAEAWQTILVDINQTMMDNGSTSEPGARSAAMSAFWSSHQRFFNTLITSMQVPTLIRDMQQKLKDGNSVVIQLVSTNEATQERRLAQAHDSDMDLADVDLTPRDTIIQFLQNSFPTELYEEYEDESGNIRSRPVTNADGETVKNPEAEATQERLIEAMAGLAIPEGPLEQIINHFGSKAVAEVTSRKRRVVRKTDGSVELEKLGASVQKRDIKEFEDGKRRILVFSNAGGTGRDYHASNQIKNQQRRFHYLLEPGWIADKAMQGMGRTHRTDQANQPHYTLLSTDINAQKRFVSTIARRLAQLGALTRGQRETTSTGLMSAADNLEDNYAIQALQVLWMDLEKGRIAGLSYEDVIRQMGLINEAKEESGGQRKEPEVDIRKFLNRLLSMDLDMQNRLFDAFEAKIKSNVAWAKEQGTYEDGIEKITGNTVTKLQQTVVWEQEGKGKTEYVVLETTDPADYFTVDHLDSGVKWVRNKQSKQLWAAEDGGTVFDRETGNAVNTVKLIGIRGTSRRVSTLELLQKFDEVKLSKQAARREWDDMIARAPAVITNETHLITGALLPVWDRLPEYGVKIFRATTTDTSESFLGRVIPKDQLNKTLKALGLNQKPVELSASELAEQVLSGSTAHLSNDWIIKRSRVSGDYRIEIKGSMSHSDYAMLARQGATSEIIQYQKRVFVPLGNAADVLKRITEGKPVIEIHGANEPVAFSALAKGDNPTGIQVEQGERIVAWVKKAFNLSGRKDIEFLVHKNQDEILNDSTTRHWPDDVKEGIRNARALITIAKNENGEPVRYRIYGFTNMYSSAAQFREGMRHELIGHFGLDTLSPQDKQALLDKVKASRNRRGIRDVYDDVAKTYADHTEDGIAEEVVAHMAHRNPNIFHTGWFHVKALIIKGLRKLKLITGPITKTEMDGIIRQLAKRIRQGGLPTFKGTYQATGGNIRFSRAGGPATTTVATLDTPSFSLQATDQALNKAVAAEDTAMVKAAGEWRSLKTGGMKALLGVLNGRQITESFKTLFDKMGEGGNPLTNYQRLLQAMTTTKQTWAHRGDNIDDVWGGISSKEPSYNELADVMHEATLNQVDPSKPFEAWADTDQLTRQLYDLDNKYQTGEQIKPVGGWYKSADTAKNAIEAMIAKGRLVGPTWLYEIREHNSKGGNVSGWYAVATDPESVKADLRNQLVAELKRQEEYQALKDRYAGLSDDAKEVFTKARDYYSDMWGETQQAIIDRAEALLQDPQGKGKIKALVDKEFNTGALKGIYFPLQRFGDYMILGSTKEGTHFREHYMTQAEMEADIRKLTREGHTIDGSGLMSSFSGRNMAQSSRFVSEIYKVLFDADNHKLDDIDPMAKMRFMDEVNQIGLELLPDLSAAKQSIHRKGTKGFSANARRAFAHHAIHGANRLSRIKYGYLMEQQLDRMKEEAEPNNIVSTIDRKDQPKAMRVVNEMEMRHETIMNPNGHPAAALATNLAFMWFLGGSVGAGLVNLSQNVLVALPQMAAQHGWGDTVKALTKANKDFLVHGKGKMGLRESVMSLSRAEPGSGVTANEISMIKKLIADGSIDTTQAHSLAQVAGSDMRPEAKPLSKLLDSASRVMGFFFHNAETLNRETAALAAYRLHLQKNNDHEAAVDYAREAIFAAHFDYSAANRARFMKGNVAKVLLVFKQYSVNIAYLLGKNFHDWAFNSDLSPKERKKARKVLTGVLGLHFLAAGTLGLPMVGTLLTALSMFMSDEDEVYDAETDFRNTLVDLFGKEWGHAIAKGGFNAFTGLDFHSRVGLGSLFIRDPDFDATPREIYQHLLTQALGPVGSMSFSGANGLDLISQGRVFEGIERIMPKVGRDVMRAIRYESDGAAGLSGDVMVDDLTTTELMGQLVGLSPARMSEAWDAKNSVKGYEAAVKRRRSLLLAQFYRATTDGDSREVRAIRQRIRSFNQHNPEFRIQNRSLRQSVNARQRRDRETVNGIHLPDTTQGLLSLARFAI